MRHEAPVTTKFGYRRATTCAVAAVVLLVASACSAPTPPPATVEGALAPLGLAGPRAEAAHHDAATADATPVATPATGAPTGAGVLVWLTPSASDAWTDRGSRVARTPHVRLLPASAAPATVAALERDPSVRAVVANRPVRTASGGDPRLAEQWHLTGDPDARWDAGRLDGALPGAADVTLAVIDTGLVADPARPGAYHPDLACGRVLRGATFVERDGAVRHAAGAVEPPGPHASFHGTHVAGIAGACADDGLGGRGVDAAARLLPIRVFDEDGTATLAAMLAAVQWAVGLDVPGAPPNPAPADVVSISLAADGDCRGDDAPLADLFAAVARRGAVVVAAAGNDGHAEPALPAACPTVVSVGATDDVGRATAYTQRGADVYAPGGTAERGILAPHATAAGIPTYAALYGTSMATPYVAAWIARARATYPSLDTAGVYAALRASSDVTFAPCRPTRPDAGTCTTPVLHPARFAAAVADASADTPPLVVHVPDRSTATAAVRLDVWNVGPDALTVDDPTPEPPFVTVRRFGPARVPAGAATTFVVGIDADRLRTDGRAGRHPVALAVESDRGTAHATVHLTTGRDAPPPATVRWTPPPTRADLPERAGTVATATGAWRLPSPHRDGRPGERWTLSVTPAPAVPACTAPDGTVQVPVVLPDPVPPTLTGWHLPQLPACLDVRDPPDAPVPLRSARP